MPVKNKIYFSSWIINNKLIKRKANQTKKAQSLTKVIKLLRKERN